MIAVDTNVVVRLLTGDDPKPTEPAPLARFFRLNTLNISARSCSFRRSPIEMFLITDRSTSAKPGPVNRLRERSPSGFVVPGQPAAPGTQNAAGFTQDSPTPGLNVWETPANGLAIMSSPGRCVPASKLNGCPLWNENRLLNCQPCVSHFGPCEEPGIS